MNTLGPGAHVCQIYDEDAEEQEAVIAPFLKAGLDAGEQVFYVSDDSSGADVRRWLDRAGVDTSERISAGALMLRTREQWRPAGELDWARHAEQVTPIISEARRLGFAGIRFGFEATWTLDPDIPAGALRDWESTVSTLLDPDFPTRVVCQYSRRRMSADVLKSALATHAAVVVGNDLSWNPYYEASFVLRDASDDDRVTWMISQIQAGSVSANLREQRIRSDGVLAAAAGDFAQREVHRDGAERSAKSLQLANDATEELLTLVSHELRTPLTVIAGMATYLSQDGGSAELRQEATREIVSATRRMARAVENMLLLSHFEHDASEPEPILAQEILNEALALHADQSPFAVVDHVDAASREILVGVRSWSVIALANLLHNAEQYGDGYERNRVELERLGDEVQFRVCNSGRVFSDDEYESFFAPFFRGADIKETIPGAGLGLTTARRLAEAQGGRLLARERPEGGGSMFTLALPAYTGDLTER